MLTRFLWRLLLLWCVMPMVTSEAASLTRGPYLQFASPTTMSVRWRTDTVNTGRVFFGVSQTNLNQSVQESGNTDEHEIPLSGLQPATTYYYAVGTGTNILAGDESYRFRTFPAAGTRDSIRAWILGDPGTGSVNALAVYTAYLGFTGTNRTDLLLTLGDNTYENGTDAEFQTGFFTPYQEILRTTPVFPSFGNHDGRSSNSSSQTGPYYNNFSLPTAAECGGRASATEAYYSVDYGNAHFICLDSYGSDRTTNSAMYAWTKQDLTACTSTWIIAYWHHPPYSMGSYNSDEQTKMIDMRSNFLPLLEQYGVDLVLGGHSHAYERTYLMNSHYGYSGSYDFNSHALNQGNGQEGGDGAYMKPSAIKAAHSGTVYVVSGASGKEVTSLLGDHPAMQTNRLDMGSVVLDIASNRLDFVYLNKDGLISDSFSMLKGEADYDGDGMPDLWEQDKFRINVAPEDNADGDPADNLSEFIAGTDPANADSYFSITTNVLDATNFVLHWSSVSNRFYNVQWSSHLTNTMVSIATNLLYPQNSYTDTLNTALEAGFYRVEVGVSE